MRRLGRLLAPAVAALAHVLLPAQAAAKRDPRTVMAKLPQITPTGPAAAPDGSVWFGEGGTSRLGRFAPHGTLTETPVPRALSLESEFLRVDAVGPDGRVWFVRPLERRIGVHDPVTRAVVMLSLALDVQELVVVRDPADGRPTQRADQIRPDGVVQPIKLPRETGGTPTVASGPAGTYIGFGALLTRVDTDLVARVVVGIPVPRYVVDDGLGLGDGSIWIAADPDNPVVRLAPGARRCGSGRASSSTAG